MQFSFSGSPHHPLRSIKTGTSRRRHFAVEANAFSIGELRSREDLLPRICRRTASSIVFFVLCAICLFRPPVITSQAASAHQQSLERLKAITELQLPGWRFVEGDPLNAETAGFDDSGWKTFRVGEEWNTGPAWFRSRVQLPEKFGGYAIRGGTLHFRLRISGENPVHLAVYFNGAKAAEGNDLDPVLLTTNAEPGTTIVIAIRAGVPGGRTSFSQAQIELDAPSNRPDPRLFFQEALSAQILIAGSPATDANSKNLDSALDTLDWSTLERGDQSGFDQSMNRGRERLRSLLPWLRTFNIQATGNSHIDMAWLWPWTETVEVTRNTFDTVLRLMREYPDFTFTHSSVVTYAWMEEKYPKMFEQIQQRVHEGRWETVGGMWVEPDLNMPDGESLVRQLLVGTRYIKQKFGVDVHIGWNPDSFGYNWQLPQIYKRSGIDSFVTQKIYWNDTTKFPHKLFWWQSPDGSRILTYFPHNYGNPIEPVEMARDLAEYTNLTHIPTLMHLYGVGDHGGGPTRSMLQTAHQWGGSDVVYPRLKIAPVQAFFDSMKPQLPSVNVPVWNDELYLEYHRGVYTSQAALKRDNRRNEELLLNAEKFSALSSLRSGKYPDLSYAWQKLLFNQFHDVMAGSAVGAVYQDAARDHAEVRHIAGEALDRSLSEIASHVQTSGDGVPVLVVNPLSWTRNDMVEVHVQFPTLPASVVVKDAKGRELSSDVVASDAATGGVTVRFLIEQLPALGYEVVHVVPGNSVAPAKSSLKAADDTLENEFIRVRIDRGSGCITSLLDKGSNREMLASGACGNLLQAFYDKPREYDAWNIDADYEKQHWDINKADEVKLIEQGRTRTAIRVTRHFRDSTVVQEISVSPRIPRVDIHNSVDWREHHILLKAAFPLSVQSDFATYEMPYGSIRRPTTRRTPAERAKFEVPALRWADLSDDSHGVSLLNDSKYGYDCRDNVLRLTLLRSPTYPDPNADQGHHEFTYSLYPHTGSWSEAGTIARGYELNYKLLTRVEMPHRGDLPSTYSFAALEPANLILTSVKKAEDDNSLLFRFYEAEGRNSQARLRVPIGATSAVETNLMEKEEGSLQLRENEVRLSVQPYQIRTLKVRFANRP
jgi:alpha-mannosidase